MDQTSLPSLIPESKRGAVEKALRGAFGVTTVESIALLTGGLTSALVYKIVVSGKPCVLRLVMEVNDLTDPVRHYACMRAAAQAGVAPKIYYTDTEDAISITEFIESVPLFGAFASPDDLLLEMVKIIKLIQATPLFPEITGVVAGVSFLDSVDWLIGQFKALELLPESATEEHFSYYAEIQKVYPRHDTDLVSSHNDLSPNNLLFDGEKIWVIDWEMGYRNDRYVDLAVVAIFFVADEAQEEVYLQAYFGAAIDDYRRARFFLMQQVCYVYFAMAFMQIVGATRSQNAEIDVTMETPSLREVGAQITSGEVSLASSQGQVLLANVLLNKALENMKTPRFARSITLMASHNA